MVVVGSPLRDFVSCICQAQEPVLFEAAVPELAVEALDERVLRRLARLDEGQRHLPLTRPEEHRLAGQLRPVIADNRGRQRALLRDLVQEPGQPMSRDRRVHQLANTLAAEIVHDVQHTKTASRGQLVRHEVLRQALVGPVRYKRC